MFVLRSLFWLSTVVMLLPPSEAGSPPPRVNLIHAAYAARVLLQDVTGVCERNPDACAVSKQALALFGRKIETGADIVSAGIAVSRGKSASTMPADHGTLTEADLDPAWSLAGKSRN